MRSYLKALREKKGISMQEMADKLDISRQYYQMIESGERQKKMDITLAKGISVILSEPLEKIVREEERRNSNG